jgi:hypothetical protein
MRAIIASKQKALQRSDDPGWIAGHCEVETPAGAKFSTYGLPGIWLKIAGYLCTSSMPSCHGYSLRLAAENGSSERAPVSPPSTIVRSRIQTVAEFGVPTSKQPEFLDGRLTGK